MPQADNFIVSYRNCPALQRINRARFPNPEGLLLPGMYVRANLAQMTFQNAILVPQIGVSRDPQGNATVLLVGKDGKAVLRPITANKTIGDKWIVTGGLKPGDKVLLPS